MVRAFMMHAELESAPSPKPFLQRRSFMALMLAAFLGGLAVGWFVSSAPFRSLAHTLTRKVVSRTAPRVQINLESAKERLRQAAGLPAGFVLPLPSPRLVVHKAQRTMDLFNGERLVKRYQIALGPAPDGPKQRQGDGKTPEGTFYLCTLALPRNGGHLFLGLNYPQAADAQAAFKRGALTPKQRDAIIQAERNHKCPPWDTPLGGAIGIHAGTTLTTTSGCISVIDEDAAEIYAATAYWSPIMIEK